MLTGAIIGAIGALIGILIVFTARKQKYNKLMASVNDPSVQYSALFYYASPGRYQKKMKIYDSYGILYLIGNTAYYKTSTTTAPIAFDLKECKLQQEAEWRKLKWFSITTPASEKYYFVSFQPGAFVNNSDESVKALNLFMSKK